ARAPEQVRVVWSVGHQTSRFDVVPRAVHRWQSCAQRQSDDSNPVCVYERVVNHIKCIRAALERLESWSDIFGSPDFGRGGFETESACCFLSLVQLKNGIGISNIGDDCQTAETGDHISQKFQSLGGKIRLLA